MSCYYKSLFVLASIICLISLVQSFNNGGVTIDLIHRDSPLSPSYDPTKTRFERLRSAFDRSFARKSSILSTLDGTTSAPVRANGGEYLMEYKIGTPPVRQLSIADTGSDLTWIQCKPCKSCYTQDYPLFDPTSTKTYRPVSCQANQCTTSGLGTSCGNSGECLYEAGYGDRSFSHGELAADTLTLGDGASFSKFVFGCGTENAGTFTKEGSGIFGLGGGAVSFVKQQGSFIDGKFSYCLTFDSKVASKISFGSNAVVAGPDVVSTPLVSKAPDTYYYLTLQGLSVGTERFNLDKYEESDSSEGNIIIDSGTTLTYVPAEVCTEVEEAMAKAIKGKRVEDARGTFNLCYEIPSGGGLNPPTITAHFDGGADVVLPKGNTFVEVEEGVVCLSVVPSQSLAIFGNLHQEGYLIGYDLVKKQVSFQQTKDCTD